MKSRLELLRNSRTPPLRLIAAADPETVPAPKTLVDPTVSFVTRMVLCWPTLDAPTRTVPVKPETLAAVSR